MGLTVKGFQGLIVDLQTGLDAGIYGGDEYRIAVVKNDIARYKFQNEQLNGSQRTAGRMGTAGRVLMGIGGALLIASAVMAAVQLYIYYQRTFTPIPRMIVDESDIVTYLTDEKGEPILDESGNQAKNVDFNTYEYYEAVKCNRQEVGQISDWQDCVDAYADIWHLRA